MKHLRLGMPVFITLIVIGIVSSILWFKSPLFGRWAGNQYFGEIIAIDGNSITLNNREHSTQIITLNRETKIFKGAHPGNIEQLVPKTPVIVIGEIDNAGIIHAKAIRIFPPRKNQ